MTRSARFEFTSLAAQSSVLPLASSQLPRAVQHARQAASLAAAALRAALQAALCAGQSAC